MKLLILNTLGLYTISNMLGALATFLVGIFQWRE